MVGPICHDLVGAKFVDILSRPGSRGLVSPGWMNESMNESMFLLGAVDLWTARWLTPVWLLCMGATLGVVLLLLFLGLVTLLSKIPFFDRIRYAGWTGHVVALILAIPVGLAVNSFAWQLMGGSGARQMSGADEQFLIQVAVVIVTAVLAWAIVFCSNGRFVAELRSLLFEGIGYHLTGSLMLIALLGLGCSIAADSPWKILQSVPQIFSSGEVVHRFTIPGSTSDSTESGFVPVDMTYNASLLQRVTINSDRNIVIGDSSTLTNFKMLPVQVEARRAVEWVQNATVAPPIPAAPDSVVHIQNREIDPAEVEFRLITLPETQEVWTIIVVGAIVFIFGVLFFLMEGFAPRTSAIGLSAAKSEIGQPLFAILMTLGVLLIASGVIVPFYTFGEDIKFLKECGITIVLVLALFQGVWSASSSVSEEIEGRTALTVLSKPVNRFSFIFGKMFGVSVMLAFMFIVMGFVLLVCVAYKPIYEAKENSLEQPLWQACHLEMFTTIPGLIMAYFHSLVLSCFAVAFATRLPQLANFSVCFAIYIIGHLTETLVGSSEGGFAILQFIGQLIAVIIPDFEHFSMQAAIDSGNQVPLSYLAGTLVYSLLYTCLALLVGLLLFEDRDLA